MIYVQHFGLREPPFGITPDTSFFYACRSSQEALNTLLVALSNGEGFIKITGEVGSGKTLLCRKFLATLDTGWVSAYIPNPNLEPRTLLLAMAEELSTPVETGVDQHHLLRGINRTLLDLARQHMRVVLCMDESQAMPLETLETVRLLTNLETEKRKLLHVVLFGQPELDRKLACDSIRQLRQRITFQYRMGSLTESEVAAYVTHRLAVAGYAGPALLGARALVSLHCASRGVPRLVNILMHKAMLLVYGEGGSLVERRHMRAAIEDTPAAKPLGRSRWLRLIPMRAIE
ncbi:MAG TPA: AAA family ATPase [Burkholderiales bacterium]|nr:AAA family ATPase [Burkholderiales bacterium]